MTHKEFDKFLEMILTKIKSVLASKSADYSDADDKLYNFKLAAKINQVSDIGALRGMWLKHQTSLKQGADDWYKGKKRPLEWWLEKSIDNINYNILLLALIKEKLDE